jgi:hypothetical protein
MIICPFITLGGPVLISHLVCISVLLLGLGTFPWSEVVPGVSVDWRWWWGRRKKNQRKQITVIFICFFWAPVTHAYNPSYSGGRDQEYHSLKQAWANSSRDPILKNPSQKYRAGRIGSRWRPRGQATILQKKKKKKSSCFWGYPEMFS